MSGLFLKRSAGSIVVVCLFLFGVFFSCSTEEEVTPSKSEPSRELVDFLVNSGFHEDEIKFEDGLFIIDEDILISETEVRNYLADQKPVAGGRAEHWRGTYIVSDTYVTNIKFFIGSDVSSSWATAIRGAIDQWNAVNGTKLFMSEVTSSGAANTVIGTSYSSQNWVARAYLPSSRRRPGHSITINTKYNSLNSSYKLFTIVHEMGHVFGLYHTDQTQGIFINGTPSVDPNSVMNSYVLPWNGFTSGDVSAVQILYPE